MSGARHHARAGFTLIEIMAALLFLALAIPAIMNAISASSRSSEAAERTAIAAQLADNQLSQVIIDTSATASDSGSSSGSSSSSSSTTGTSGSSSTSGGGGTYSGGDHGDFGNDYPGYRWEMKQEAWTASSDMTQYTISVFFQVKGVERSVELSTLIGQTQ